MDRLARLKSSALLRHYRYLGMAGSAVIALGMAVAMVPYRGRSGEAFSILNHFISELGQPGVAAKGP
ncbi:MAG TPA: hypothetical protein PLJ35_12810 [Anaerolineae bacterium]|nr:hypothetical protein [Anaerolineae bacterium]HPL28272.1 hypothetical protein [Anaerolineae bacterium]